MPMNLCAVFLVVKKAFDSVPYKPLSNTLFSINLPSHLSCWLSSYLTARSHDPQEYPKYLFLALLSSFSTLKILPYSLFQPTLLTLYADDILLFHPFSSTSSFNTVQFDIEIISSWLSSNLLVISPNKNKYMIITHRSLAISCFPALVLNSIPLEMVLSFTYLVVTFTSNLSWSLHINKVCTN